MIRSVLFDTETTGLDPLTGDRTRIVVEAVERPRGWQAFRVISLDQATALHPSELPMPRTHVTVTPTSGLPTWSTSSWRSAGRTS